MLPDRLTHAFGELIVERLDQAMPDDPDAAVEWLEDILGNPDRTEALITGAGIDLDERERAALSDVLLLDPMLLSALFTPTSSEVLVHMLREIVPASPGEADDPCEHCVSLAARVSAATPSTPQDDLEDLVFDALEHLVSESAPITDGHLAEMIGVFAGLSTAGRLRVLAAAYEEEEREKTSTPANAISELARTRDESMSEAAREMMDLLALAPSGSLSASDIVTSLSLPGVAALAGIEQDLEHCASLLASRNVTDAIVIKVHRAGQAHYSLNPVLVAPMRALLRAERQFGGEAGL